jgi:hypothetical protein
VAEGEEEAGDGELESGLVELGGIEIVEEVEGGLLVSPETFEPVLFEEPALVMRAAAPGGEVADGDAPGVVAETGQDVLSFDSVAEHKIELVADGFGELGDFTAWGAGDFGR